MTENRTMKWDIIPEILSILVVIIILGNSRYGNAIPSARDKMFRFCLYYTLFCTALNIASIQAVYQAQFIPLWLNMTINTAYFALYPLLPLIFIMYLLLYVHEFTPHEHQSRLKLFITILVAIMATYLCIIFLNLSTKWLFYFDSEGNYQRGPYNQLSLLVASTQILVALYAIWLERAYLDRTFFSVFLWLPPLSLSIIVVQYFFPNVILTGIAITLAILSVYLNFQTRRINIDSLTQYPNRGSFIHTIDQIRRFNRKTLVIIVSLDNFKIVNDTYGQKRGNLFLRSVAEGLHELLPQGQVYRYSGDEFAITIHDSRGDDIAQTILQRFSSSWYVEGISNRLQASIVTLRLPFKPYPEVDPLTLIDHAIRTAKNRGKGQVVHCDSLLLQTIQRKQQLVDCLSQVFLLNSLSLEFQPIYDIETGDMTMAEALLRMNDPQIGNVPPSEFIPIAEEIGMIEELGRWVFEQVCTTITSYRAKGKVLPPISVNFSGLQFNNRHIAQELIEIVDRYKIPPDSIHIELTESTFIGAFFNDVLDIMKPLIDHGISFHLDDFGTGYSNLSYIVNLPFYCIKIDKSLLWDVQDSNRSQKFIESMITVVRDLGYHVIVEGVESKEQLEYLKSIHCDMVQGYFLNPPGSQEQIFQMQQSIIQLDKNQ